MTTPRTPNLVLRAWRETHGLSRPQMADALNRTPSALLDQLTCDAKHIAKWESGLIRWPSPRYQRALHDLTGRYADSLGFTSTIPGQPAAAQPPVAPPAVQPASTSRQLPTDADLYSIGDLSDLAAELSTRGYTTALNTQPPRLTLGNPSPSNHQHIITIGPCFCLDDVPFSLRPPMPLTITADAIDALTNLVLARQHNPN